MKKMDSMKQSSVTPLKSKLARTFAKVLHIRVATGIAPLDGIKNTKLPQLKSKEAQFKIESLDGKKDEEYEILRKREALEAVLAKIFASISSVKASYAQLQYAQSPYDADGIESADKLIVSELKSLSELKQSFIKKQFDASPQTTFILAEIQEQKSLSKTYEIMAKRFGSQAKLKESEITFLREKLKDLNELNQRMEPRPQSGPLSVLDNLHLSGLAPNHFSMMLHHAMKSVRSFVRLMIDEMKSADWNIDAAAAAIEPGVAYSRPDHKCFAFESFVCREMFDSFQNPNFSLPNESIPSGRFRNLSFDRFLELKPLKATEYLARNPRSTFAKFCRVKYLRLVHPKMESAFFGNLNQRNLLDSGIFPETTFFAMFGEMARRVWLLHCLAFSFEPEASIFQVARGCRFSEVYMETVAEDVPDNNAIEYDPRVAFTVVPGFKIGKTVIQCQVYLCNYALR